MSDSSTYSFKVFCEEQLSKDPMEVVTKENTVIGNDVWIGNCAIIMEAVKVGRRPYYRQDSLVTKDVPAYTIVGGNPAKEIRKRFDEEIIQMLLTVKCWDWDVQKIMDNLEATTSGKIDK